MTQTTAADQNDCDDGGMGAPGAPTPLAALVVSLYGSQEATAYNYRALLV
jgi:hypothetical protein